MASYGPIEAYMAKTNEPKTGPANQTPTNVLEEKVKSVPAGVTFSADEGTSKRLMAANKALKPELPVTGTFIHTPGPQGYLIGVAAGEKVILELENAKNLLEQGIVKKEK